MGIFERELSGAQYTQPRQRLKNMKKFIEMASLAPLLLVSILMIGCTPELKPKPETKQAAWIKQFFKDKEPVSLSYTITQEGIIKEQLLRDFTTQTGIEHIEPIAVGKSIDDPQIAKFNTACPNKKPINIYREVIISGIVKQPQPSEEELEDPKNEYIDITYQYKCTGNLKIYQFNVYNTPDNKQDYVLYCDDLIYTNIGGNILNDEDEKRKKEPYKVEGAYLTFDPNECLYPKRLDRFHSQLKDFMTGIFKYKGKYYFYTIETSESFKFEGKEETNLSIWREGTNDYGHSFGKSYIMKGILK